MADVDFTNKVWLISKIRKIFEDLFQKYQRLSKGPGFTKEKVNFLTTLNERNPHDEIQNLNQTLKNIISVG